jgi:hypothetical protein
VTVACVYLPDGRQGPGRLGEVDLEVCAVGPAELVLPEATVRDERGGVLFEDGSPRGLVFDPVSGGGPLVAASVDRRARAFGVVNTAFHVQRALRFAAGLLGRPVPRVVVRIGMHDEPPWGGGHYRLPRPGDGESMVVEASGEVHLGGGRAFVTGPDRYFAAPSHNNAIIYHEIGHHLCRHTADFRLNRLRPVGEQVNMKIALDEGTSDAVTAILLGTPDIYGWHRRHIPVWDQRRRKLDAGWTMAYFRGGRESDPHADGTVWASACWSARQRVVAAGVDPVRFDAMLLRGLDLAGQHDVTTLSTAALRSRRHFSRLLTAMTRIDPDLAPDVLTAMADHDIHPEGSNAELRETARASLEAVRA